MSICAGRRTHILVVSSACLGLLALACLRFVYSMTASPASPGAPAARPRPLWPYRTTRPGDPGRHDFSDCRLS